MFGKKTKPYDSRALPMCPPFILPVFPYRLRLRCRPQPQKTCQLPNTRESYPRTCAALPGTSISNASKARLPCLQGSTDSVRSKVWTLMFNFFALSMPAGWPRLSAHYSSMFVYSPWNALKCLLGFVRSLFVVSQSLSRSLSNQSRLGSKRLDLELVCNQLRSQDLQSMSCVRETSK